MKTIVFANPLVKPTFFFVHSRLLPGTRSPAVGPAPLRGTGTVVFIRWLIMVQNTLSSLMNIIWDQQRITGSLETWDQSRCPLFTLITENGLRHASCPIPTNKTVTSFLWVQLIDLDE